MKQAQIQLDQETINTFAARIAPIIKAFFDDPKNMAEFEKWQEEKSESER